MSSEDKPKEEESSAHFEPLVKLDEVAVKTGEDEEDELFKQRAKLFIFVKEDVYGGEKRENFWKERGLGNCKLLKGKVSGKTRLLMRQEKTLKIVINHNVDPLANLQEMVTSEKSWVHRARDFSDPDDPKETTFAIRFKDAETAQQFKEKFDEAKESNKAAGGGEAKAPAAEGEAKADDAAAPAAGEGGGDIAAIDAAIAARNKTDSARRKSVQATLALDDPEYDSDEEDVDEGAKERVKQQFAADKSVMDAAAKLEAVKVEDGASS